MCVAFATTSVLAEEAPSKKPSFAGFQTNGFWSNWEISAGFGVGTALSNKADLGAYGDRFGIQGNVSLTKWLHPVYGLRAELQGGRFSNFHPTYGRTKWPYLFAHFDFMLNLSNWIGGYREDRVYYAVPYIGGGYMASNFTDDSQSVNHQAGQHDFALAYGLLNKFRVSPRFDLNVEFKGLWAQSDLCPAEMPGKHLFGFAATFGVTYRFKHRGWTRALDAAATAATIAAYQKAADQSKADLEDAEAENARMAKELEDAQAAAKRIPETVVVESEGESMSILFDCGSARVASKERTRLELIARAIKNAPEDKKFHIVGHADAQTGTPAFNKTLSEKRAKIVYDYLVKSGIDADRLTYEGVGDTQDVHEDYPRANRIVTVD